MCDFKPGDEVACIHRGPWFRIGSWEIEQGPSYRQICTVVGVEYAHGRAGIFLRGQGDESFAAHLFRKIQRRDLSAWLATTNTIEEPKRTPAKAPA